MIDYNEAAALVAKQAIPLHSEQVALAGAHGRILAEPAIAAVSSPPQDMSAMDGYAVRSSDLARSTARLPVTAEIFAGTVQPDKLIAGECARIFTGAPIPDGADRVVIQEDVEREGDFALFAQTAAGGTHIRPAGGDFNAGDTLLPAGRKLDFRALTLIAGGDLPSVMCHALPRVALLSTGDELAAPGEARERPGTIPESISVGLTALVVDWGGRVVSHTRLADDLPVMQRAAAKAVLEADIIVVVGGASVGDRDFAQAMFGGGNLELIFSKVAMKPGKPVWFAQTAARISGEPGPKSNTESNTETNTKTGSTLIIGLPGNPSSALVTARLLLAPLLAGMSGGDPADAWRWMQLEAAGPMEATGDREEFIRAAMMPDARAKCLSNQFSSMQHTLAAADLLVRRPAGSAALVAGDPVDALAF